MIIILYVDDITLLGNSLDQINKIKAALSKRYDMNDLGETRTFLGLRIRRNRKQRTIMIDQSRYIGEVLDRFGMSDCNPARTPLPSGIILEKNKGLADEKFRSHYQQLIGSLMYAMIGTRPDIAYAVTRLAQFSSNPSQDHLKAAKHVLRYLRQTQFFTICYDGNDTDTLWGYSDSDWGEDRDDRKSTSGYVFYLAGALIGWVSRKQPIVALSSTEAEYIAMSESAKQIKWYTQLFRELGFNHSPVTLYANNRGAKDLAQKAIIGRRSKHIDIKFHNVRDMVEEKSIVIICIPSEENVADALTKALGLPKFSPLVDKMGFTDEA